MNLKYETSFTVYPQHTNCKSPLIFGGAFFGEIDKAAATAVRRFLYSSRTCETAVTYTHEGKFLKPCYMGDLIFLEAEILSVGNKSVVVEVNSFRETSNEGLVVREHVAHTKFVFVTLANDDQVDNKPNLLPYCPHGVAMSQKFDSIQ